MGSLGFTMGWLTCGLSLCLAVTICSVHIQHQEEEIKGPKKEEGGFNLDLKNLFSMANKYLGDDGMEKLMGGDYSQLEKIGKQILGEDGKAKEMLKNLEGKAGDVLQNVLKTVAPGALKKESDKEIKEEVLEELEELEDSEEELEEEE